MILEKLNEKTADLLTKAHEITTGEELREWRETAGFTPADLAAVTGYSRAYISLLESDQRPVTDTVRTLLKTAAVTRSTATEAAAAAVSAAFQRPELVAMRKEEGLE